MRGKQLILTYKRNLESNIHNLMDLCRVMDLQHIRVQKIILVDQQVLPKKAQV